jgi:hypothetical protein
MRVADALQDEVLRRHVQHGHVVARVELLDDELVFAADPGEEVHEDALDVHLDRGDQLSGSSAPQLHQDRAQAQAGPDALAGLDEVAHRDLAAHEQHLAHALVRLLLEA